MDQDLRKQIKDATEKSGVNRLDFIALLKLVDQHYDKMEATITQSLTISQSLKSPGSQTATTPIEIIFDSVTEALMSVSEDGTIRNCNKVCSRYFGIAKDDLIGSPISGTITLQGRTQAFPAGDALDNLDCIPMVTRNPGDVTVNVNIDGSFEFVDVPDGTYTLTAKSPGYVSRERIGVVVAEASITVPSVQMRAGLVNGDDVDNINDITATVASFGTTTPTHRDSAGRFVDVNRDA